MEDSVLKNKYFELNGQLSNKFMVQLLVPSLLHLTRVCLWITLKQFSLKLENYNLWCGLDISTMFVFIWTHGEQDLQTFLHSLN